MEAISDNAIAEAVLLLEAERQLDLLKSKLTNLQVRYNRVLDQRNQLHEIATDMWTYGAASLNSKSRWIETIDKFEALDEILNQLED